MTYTLYKMFLEVISMLISFMRQHHESYMPVSSDKYFQFQTLYSKLIFANWLKLELFWIFLKKWK